MRKSTVIQCKRCQRFQHSTSSCSFNYRCVQCSNNHGPGECPRIKNTKLPLQCCNCVTAGLKNINHTANDLLKCEFFKTKHAQLFNKFKSAMDSKAKNTSTGASKKSIGIGSIPNSSNNSTFAADLLATPAAANNPHLKTGNKKKEKKKVIATGPDRSRNGFDAIKNSNVSSGGSHTGSVLSDDKLNALAVALVDVLKRFL